MAKKTRKGRPPKIAADRHSRVIRIKVTPANGAELDSAAGVAGKPLTVWARDILLKAARRNK